MNDGGGEDGPGRAPNGGAAPVDHDLLERLEARLRGSERFDSVEAHPELLPRELICRYDDRLYPAGVDDPRLEIVWYENGDFSVHYHETHEEGSFDHRWDRHPSDHNDRDHVHPVPSAPTPGEDASHPEDWRDVVAEVLREIEERQRAFWSEE